MSNQDYVRAGTAVEALDLNGANKEIAQYWLSRWYNGAPPSMSSFQRDMAFNHAPAINIFEIRESESVRCIKGAEFVKLTAGFDLTNQNILSLTDATDRDALLAWMWQIASGAVSVYFRSYRSEKGSSGLVQGVALPFSNADKGARYFLSHTNWRPVGNEWVTGNVHIDLQIPATKRVISFNPSPPEIAWV